MAYEHKDRGSGEPILSQEWNSMGHAIVDLEKEKVNRSGDTIQGALTIQNGALVVSGDARQAPVQIKDAKPQILLMEKSGDGADGLRIYFDPGFKIFCITASADGIEDILTKYDAAMQQAIKPEHVPDALTSLGDTLREIPVLIDFKRGMMIFYGQSSGFTGSPAT